MNKIALGFLFAWLVGPVSLFAADIRDVQTELKSQGFYYGEVDGQSGGETAAAIKRYQIRNGLEVTGTANKETLEALGIGGGAGSSVAPKTSRPTTPAPPVASTPPTSRPPTHLRREDPSRESDREFLEREDEVDPDRYDDPSVVRPPAPLRPPANPEQKATRNYSSAHLMRSLRWRCSRAPCGGSRASLRGKATIATRLTDYLALRRRRRSSHFNAVLAFLSRVNSICGRSPQCASCGEGRFSDATFQGATRGSADIPRRLDRVVDHLSLALV
jgi:hypothetical protein